MFALLIHMYYEDSWEKIFRQQLKELNNFSPVIMINLCNTNPNNRQIVSTIKAEYPSALIITTPNKGKDIGGKLALIDFFIRTNQSPEFMVFLHDKISPYSVTGDIWRNKLFRIVDPANIQNILTKFQANSKIGIVGAGEFIKTEFDKEESLMKTRNSTKIDHLLHKYNLVINDYTFIAGTMFWIRSSIVKKFFSIYTPLACREMLEEGDSTDQHEGTYTHSWERVFCWLANNQGYTIKGI